MHSSNMKTIIFVVTVLVASASANPGFDYGFPEGRVIGGVDATPHQFPFIVSVQLKVGGNYQHWCGGSIVNERHVVTAGHCISPGEWEVVAGIHNLKKKEASAQRVKIAKSFVHPLFPGGNVVAAHDIAVIRVKTKFVFNNYVKPIALPAANSNPTGTGTLAGWGSTSTSLTPKYPDILQTVQLPIISYDKCLTVFSSPPLHRTNLCAGPVTGGKGGCNADSGGPFISQGLRTTLIGTVSYGPKRCGSSPGASVFVRVSDHLDFINQHING